MLELPPATQAYQRLLSVSHSAYCKSKHHQQLLYFLKTASTCSLSITPVSASFSFYCVRFASGSLSVSCFVKTS